MKRQISQTIMMQPPSVAPIQFSQALNAERHFYFYDHIGEACDYVEFVYTLDNSQRGDVVHLHLNTEGGDMFSTIAMIHAIGRTNAHVIGHADGLVASAGTFLFLACHEYEVNEFALFMFHDGSTGNIGKFSENRKSSEATSDLYDRMAKRIYMPFFSEEEVSWILRGDDCYQSAEEMVERINIVEEIMNNMAKEESKE